MTTKTDPQLIIDRMKIRLEELQEQMPVIAELEARIEELEAENDHTAFDALAEKYELAKDKIKTLEAEKEWYKGTLTAIAVNSESDKTKDTAYRALQTIKEAQK